MHNPCFKVTSALFTLVASLSLGRSDNDHLLGESSWQVIEEDSNFWNQKSQDVLRSKLSNPIRETLAKNVIFFLGDGMSLATITASRILKGQKVNNSTKGEEAELHMDSFPFTGVSKVLILAKGPFSHLLSGVVEQNYIPHALAYAACLTSNNPASHCKSPINDPPTTTATPPPNSTENGGSGGTNTTYPSSSTTFLPASILTIGLSLFI